MWDFVFVDVGLSAPTIAESNVLGPTRTRTAETLRGSLDPDIHHTCPREVQLYFNISILRVSTRSSVTRR